MPATQRTIFHVDMDAFFAAIEQLDHPELRGKPIVVGHDGPRGVVSTASYEARKFGCHSAQPVAVAKRRCPNLIVVPVRGKRYREVADQVFDIFERYTPIHQPLSIDEAFLDMTGTQRLLGQPLDVARRLKRDIFESTQLTASIGVAPNKFLAKFASDLHKPDGLTWLGTDNLARRMHSLPIRDLWGVGPAMAQRFNAADVRTIGDLAARDPDDLQRRFGDAGTHFHRLAHGIDDRRVTPDRDARSISQERTFGQDVRDVDVLRWVLLSQTENVARRLRRHERLARTVHLKLRYGQFETITRSHTLDEPTELTQPLWDATWSLMNKWIRSGFRAVRLIGMGVSGLTDRAGLQMSLFDQTDRQKQSQLDQTLDRIAERFGKGSVHRGPRA